MVNFDSKQRTLIADKLFDAANVAVGGMVFGQFLAERPFSLMLAAIGLMTGLYILLGGITLFATIVVVLDGISYRRKQRGIK